MSTLLCFITIADPRFMSTLLCFITIAVMIFCVKLTYFTDELENPVLTKQVFVISSCRSDNARSGPEVIKLFFVLNSAVHEICPANKSQIINNGKCFLANIAKHENFSANK